MRWIPILFVALVASSCTMRGELAEESRGKLITCKDTRDGETFSFYADTIEEVRVGVFAPTTFTVTTTDGRKRELSSDSEPWLKCSALEPDPGADEPVEPTVKS